MRKFWILCFAVCMTMMAGCGSQEKVVTSTVTETTKQKQESVAESSAKEAMDTIPVILNQTEYLLYQDVFYNDNGETWEGKEVKKEGVFTTIQDEYNQRTRYYVWGYLDKTLCCDWQWEFIPKDASQLPSEGSKVQVTGTFNAGEDALDGYWILDADVKTVQEYAGADAEVNMSTMSDTLERVQFLNIQAHPDKFIGKSALAYGRIAGAGVLEDPYYNGSWQAIFESEDELPAIGTDVVLDGVLGQDGTLEKCKILLR